jgi:hypothetical protein
MTYLLDIAMGLMPKTDEISGSWDFVSFMELSRRNNYACLRCSYNL